LAAARTVFGDHRAGWPDGLVEMIEDRRALDQHLAVVEHQRRHPAQRIVGRDLVGVAECRPRPMLEWQIIEPQRDPYAPHERGIELADQDHVPDVSMILLLDTLSR